MSKKRWKVKHPTVTHTVGPATRFKTRTCAPDGTELAEVWAEPSDPMWAKKAKQQPLVILFDSGSDISVSFHNVEVSLELPYDVAEELYVAFRAYFEARGTKVS